MQHIRDITDPEHPYTLEQLNVVSEEQVQVDDAAGTVKVRPDLSPSFALLNLRRWQAGPSCVWHWWDDA
jgi:hypothetical protein